MNVNMDVRKISNNLRWVGAFRSRRLVICDFFCKLGARHRKEVVLVVFIAAAAALVAT